MHTYVVIGRNSHELRIEASGYRVENNGELTFFQTDSQRVKRNICSMISGEWVSVVRSDVKVKVQ